MYHIVKLMTYLIYGIVAKNGKGEIKMKKIESLGAKCNFCGANAKYDAPTRDGRWGYMCKGCFSVHKGNNAKTVGYEFVETEPSIR